MNKKVSVLMPVYNAELFVRDAIKSILNQTYKDFEFLIIDDGSKDNSVKIIEEFNDKRINLICNKTNLKLVKTLNKGIDLIKSEYIVRMDADDISLPDRIEKQIAFMDANPYVGISGTWTRNFGRSKNLNVYPVTDEKIKTMMIFKSPLSHPSVIMRMNFLNQYNLRYNDEYLYAEDYDMWLRCSQFFKFANIPEVLLLYRIGNNNVSRTSGAIQNELTRKLLKKNLVKLGLKDENLLDIIIYNKAANKETLYLICDCLKKIINRNDYYNKETLEECVQDLWNLICYKSSINGLTAFIKYYNFEIGKNRRFSKLKELRFLFKSILKI